MFTYIFLLSSYGFAGDPWTLEKQRHAYHMTYVSESFEDRWLGTEKFPIADISQTTFWLGYGYGLSEKLQIDLLTGFTESDFKGSDKNFSGLADSKLSLKYQWLNEYAGNRLTLALQVAAITKGSYDRSSPGNPHSPGDKAHAIEVAVPMAKKIEPITLLAELGYRNRFDDVPDDVFFNIGAGSSITSALYIQTKFYREDGQDGLTIGQAPFTGNDFHRTEEDRDILELSGNWHFQFGMDLYVGYADVLNGKNTGDSQILFLGLQFIP